MEFLRGCPRHTHRWTSPAPHTGPCVVTIPANAHAKRKSSTLLLPGSHAIRADNAESPPNARPGVAPTLQRRMQRTLKLMLSWQVKPVCPIEALLSLHYAQKGLWSIDEVVVVDPGKPLDSHAMIFHVTAQI